MTVKSHYFYRRIERLERKFYNLYITMKKFINIHTHLNYINKNEIAIKNLFPGEEHTIINKENLFYSIGIHPMHINPQTIEKDKESLFKCLKEEAIVAIGETGLDRRGHIPFVTQAEIFAFHIRLANEINKPIIIHCVRAYQETVRILKETGNKMPVIFHGYNNDMQTASMLIGKGFYLSIGAALLNKNSNAAKIWRNLETCHFFLENDDKEVAISRIYITASQQKNIRPEELTAVMYDNFLKVFKNG